MIIEGYYYHDWVQYGRILREQFKTVSGGHDIFGLMNDGMLAKWCENYIKNVLNIEVINSPTPFVYKLPTKTKEEQMNNKINEIYKGLQEQKKDLSGLAERYIELNANYNKMVVEHQENVRLSKPKVEQSRTDYDGGLSTLSTRILNEMELEIKRLTADNWQKEKSINAYANERIKHVMKIDELEKDIKVLTTDNLRKTSILSEAGLHTNYFTSPKVALPTPGVLIQVLCRYTHKTTGQVDRVVKTAIYSLSRGFKVDNHDEGISNYWTMEIEGWKPATTTCCK